MIGSTVVEHRKNEKAAVSNVWTVEGSDMGRRGKARAFLLYVRVVAPAVGGWRLMTTAAARRTRLFARSRRRSSRVARTLASTRRGRSPSIISGTEEGWAVP